MRHSWWRSRAVWSRHGMGCRPPLASVPQSHCVPLAATTVSSTSSSPWTRGREGFLCECWMLRPTLGLSLGTLTWHNQALTIRYPVSSIHDLEWPDPTWRRSVDVERGKWLDCDLDNVHAEPLPFSGSSSQLAYCRCDITPSLPRK